MACSTEGGRTSQKVQTEDSLPFMHSVGVSTLISDSGVIRYHLVAEEWDIYTPTKQAATWKFIKGLLMLRLDESLDVDLYVQADTAYLHKQQTWELRGRVRIRNVQGTIFKTEELFWDLDKHEMWNHTYMTIITPERTLEGTEFRSNEQMTRYSVANSKGDFPMSDAEDTSPVPTDSTQIAETTVETTAMPSPEKKRALSTDLEKAKFPSPTIKDLKIKQ
jgi:LPS export ABC transporter protein LptC